ncbi:MAG: hypothetical protein LBG65_01635 [Puniceicoccales bacterium]|jgi:hypothetical protein|nr:hypothetical protein [Puniceicoccales bacterium]
MDGDSPTFPAQKDAAGPDTWRQPAPGGPVVLFSPSRHGLYTIGVAELLRRGGVSIAAVVVRRLLNPSRLAKEFTRDGTRLLRKIWRKLLLRRLAYPSSAPYQTLPQFLDEMGTRARTVDDLQRLHGIPVIYCGDLNDAASVRVLREARPRLVVFTGGGLVRAEVLALSGDGVLNCHMGILPHYRGMDVVEWPFLEGKTEHVGMTVHFMDKGVDTGDILAVRHMEPAPGEGRDTLRGRFEVPMCRELATAAIDWLSGRISRQPQPPDPTPSGVPRQYFKLHPGLQRLAEFRMRRH